MSPHTDAGALLPCPFCGCPDIRQENTITEGSVWCSECGAMHRQKNLYSKRDGLIGAITAWNTRQAASQGSAKCDCGFSGDICSTNPCMRKKLATSGLMPDAKYPNVGKTQAASQGSAGKLVSVSFDEVACAKPGDACEWPECECRRKEPSGTFACPICGEETPHHHSTEVEKRAECSGCMNPACEDCFDPTASKGSAGGEAIRKVLGPFYRTVDVMKSARNQPDHLMSIWADDMKAVEDVMLFLEQLRDAPDSAQAPIDPTNHHNALKCPYCNPNDAVRKAVIEECARKVVQISVLADQFRCAFGLGLAESIRGLSVPSAQCEACK